MRPAAPLLLLAACATADTTTSDSPADDTAADTAAADADPAPDTDAPAESDAPVDTGTPGSTLPTTGTLALTWAVTVNGAASSCQQVAGATQVLVEVFPFGTTDGTSITLPCPDKAGSVSDLSEGRYSVSVSLADAGGVPLGDPDNQVVNVDLDPCPKPVGATCVYDVAFEISPF